MYKNQLQELAQRSCFNLPSYSCIREGPDHAPRFKATVNFNGESFDSPTFCSTLRQAEHAAAEVALTTLANGGPSKALAARILDETGVYKNLLQETAHRAGLNLPVYTTIRSGPGHVPVFSCTVELAGMSFSGLLARTKKQAQKNAAMAAWLALKRMSQSTLSSPSSSSSSESRSSEEQEQVVIARLLTSLCKSESKQHGQIDCQHGKQRYNPVCMDLNPPIAGSRAIHGQPWPYALSPEMTLYHMWQQDQLLRLQNHLFTLPLPSFPVPSPPILCQSIFHPGHGLSAPDMEQRPMVSGSKFRIANQGPALCFSDDPVSGLMSSTSSLKIQEIHEEKTEESSKFLGPVVLDSSVPCHPTSEPSNEVSALDEHKQKINSKSSLEKAEQADNHCGKNELSCNRRLGPVSRGSHDERRLQNQLSSDALQSYPRPQHHQAAYSFKNSGPRSAAAAPMALRTVSPASVMRHQPPNRPTQGPVPPRMRSGAPSLVGPRYESVNFGGMRPRSMAPAVRIRSVVPVCSAPPPKKVQYVGKEGNLPSESKSTVSDAGKKPV